MKIFTVLNNKTKICEVSEPNQAIPFIRLMDSLIYLSELIFTVRITDPEIEKNFPGAFEEIALNTWGDAVCVVDRLSAEFPGFREIFRNAAVQCSPKMARAFIGYHPNFGID